MKKSWLGLLGLLALMACNSGETKTEGTTETAAAPESKTPPQSEFADAKYTEMGKKGIAALQAGDVDGWGSAFADNAVYIWSSGDSLVGKKAILDYWKNRRGNVIDSLSLINDIWLPIKVNTPQKGPDIPGVWLLSWYQSVVKYKNGKKLVLGIHTVQHFDANDKVDRVIQYLDRAPIVAAGVK